MFVTLVSKRLNAVCIKAVGTSSTRDLNSQVNSGYNHQMAGPTHYNHEAEICEYCPYDSWRNSCILKNGVFWVVTPWKPQILHSCILFTAPNLKKSVIFVALFLIWSFLRKHKRSWSSLYFLVIVTCFGVTRHKHVCRVSLRDSGHEDSYGLAFPR
jgi:hypothetical protein